MPLPNPGMSFTPFDPLPASDLNDIVENVEALADGSGFDAAAIGGADINFAATGAGGIWWEELGRTTLGVAGDTISVTPIGARKYLRVISYTPNSGAIGQVIRFNNDSGNNYSYRYGTNGGADTTNPSQSSIRLSGGSSNPHYSLVEIHNVLASEKIVHGVCVEQGTAGAATVPDRRETAGKWVNTSAAITRIDVINDQAGDFTIGSQVVVLGHN